MVYNASALCCPKCRSVDQVHMASSFREKFPLPRQSAQGTLAVPYGAFMLVFLLASLPFLVGSIYEHLSVWPSALSAMNNLLPKPLLSAAIGVVVLLVTLDRPTRAFLLRMRRAVALDSRLYQELEVGASSLALRAVTVGVASFGWAVFLGLKSLDWWLAMAKARALAGPDWVPLAVQGFLAGGLVVLAGLPLMAFAMSWAARGFAEYGFLQRDECSPRDFALSLAYPYSLLPVAMGLAMSIGIQPLSVLAACWPLAAMFLTTRHTMKQNTELALPVALLGTVPVTLAFFFVTLRIEMNVVNSNWASFRGQGSTLPDLESSWLVGALALAALLALTPLLAAAWTRRRNARANLAGQQDVMPWQQLLYCERCGGVHLPNQEEFVPVSEVGRLLHGGRNDGQGQPHISNA